MEFEKQEEIKPKPKYYKAKAKQYMDTYTAKNKEKLRQYQKEFYKKKYEMKREEIKTATLARYYRNKELKKAMKEQLPDVPEENV